jgi:hypothetical protein
MPQQDIGVPDGFLSMLNGYHAATRRRALAVLADNPDGCTEAIMLAHGFTAELPRARSDPIQDHRRGAAGASMTPHCAGEGISMTER